MARRAPRKQLRKRATSSVQLEFDFAARARVEPRLFAPGAGAAQTFARAAQEDDDALFQAAVARVRAQWLPLTLKDYGFGELQVPIEKAAFLWLLPDDPMEIDLDDW
jgi:hypothetical protein